MQAYPHAVEAEDVAVDHPDLPRDRRRGLALVSDGPATEDVRQRDLSQTKPPRLPKTMV